MSLFNVYWLGVRLLIWLYLLMAVLCVFVVVLYWFREKIRENYYKIRFPEKVIKIVIFYIGGIYREFWRLIPKKDSFIFDGKKYLYSEESIIKDNDFYISADEEDKSRLKAKIGDKTYYLDDKLKLHKRGAKYPELHYIDGVPTPIDYRSMDKTTIKFSATDLENFAKNDLWQKLLIMREEIGRFMLLTLLVGFNMLLTLFLVSINMGWIKVK